MKIIEMAVIVILVALSLFYIINKMYQSTVKKKACAGCAGKCYSESCPMINKNLKNKKKLS